MRKSKGSAGDHGDDAVPVYLSVRGDTLTPDLAGSVVGLAGRLGDAEVLLRAHKGGAAVCVRQHSADPVLFTQGALADVGAHLRSLTVGVRRSAGSAYESAGSLLCAGSGGLAAVIAVGDAGAALRSALTVPRAHLGTHAVFIAPCAAGG